MKQPYQPINCSFYDELEILAMRKRKVTIEYRDEYNQGTSAEDVIVDVYSRNKEEFLKLRGGQIIRLDRLIRVDGKSLPGSCEISKE